MSKKEVPEKKRAKNSFMVSEIERLKEENVELKATIAKMKVEYRIRDRKKAWAKQQLIDTGRMDG